MTLSDLRSAVVAGDAKLVASWLRDHISLSGDELKEVADEDGLGPLHWVPAALLCGKGNAVMADAVSAQLLRHHASVNANTPSGESVLGLAERAMHSVESQDRPGVLALVKLLLCARAEPNFVQKVKCCGSSDLLQQESPHSSALAAMLRYDSHGDFMISKSHREERLEALSKDNCSLGFRNGLAEEANDQCKGGNWQATYFQNFEPEDPEVFDQYEEVVDDSEEFVEEDEVLEVVDEECTEGKESIGDRMQPCMIEQSDFQDAKGNNLSCYQILNAEHQIRNRTEAVTETAYSPGILKNTAAAKAAKEAEEEKEAAARTAEEKRKAAEAPAAKKAEEERKAAARKAEEERRAAEAPAAKKAEERKAAAAAKKAEEDKKAAAAAAAKQAEEERKGDVCMPVTFSNFPRDKNAVSSANRTAAQMLRTQGDAAMEEKNFGAALRFFSEGILRNPLDASLYLRRSSCLADMDRLIESLDDAVVSTYMTPSKARCWSSRAAAEAKLGRFLDAANSYDRAHQAEPSNVSWKVCAEHARGQARSSDWYLTPPEDIQLPGLLHALRAGGIDEAAVAAHASLITVQLGFLAQVLHADFSALKQFPEVKNAFGEAASACGHLLSAAPATVSRLPAAEIAVTGLALVLRVGWALDVELPKIAAHALCTLGSNSGTEASVRRLAVQHLINGLSQWLLHDGQEGLEPAMNFPFLNEGGCVCTRPRQCAGCWLTVLIDAAPPSLMKQLEEHPDCEMFAAWLVVAVRDGMANPAAASSLLRIPHVAQRVMSCSVEVDFYEHVLEGPFGMGSPFQSQMSGVPEGGWLHSNFEGFGAPLQQGEILDPFSLQGWHGHGHGHWQGLEHGQEDGHVHEHGYAPGIHWHAIPMPSPVQVAWHGDERSRPTWHGLYAWHNSQRMTPQLHEVVGVLPEPIRDFVQQMGTSHGPQMFHAAHAPAHIQDFVHRIASSHRHGAGAPMVHAPNSFKDLMQQMSRSAGPEMFSTSDDAIIAQLLQEEELAGSGAPLTMPDVRVPRQKLGEWVMASMIFLIIFIRGDPIFSTHACETLTSLVAASKDGVQRVLKLWCSLPLLHRLCTLSTRHNSAVSLLEKIGQWAPSRLAMRSLVIALTQASPSETKSTPPVTPPFDANSFGVGGADNATDIKGMNVISEELSEMLHSWGDFFEEALGNWKLRSQSTKAEFLNLMNFAKELQTDPTSLPAWPLPKKWTVSESGAGWALLEVLRRATETAGDTQLAKEIQSDLNKMQAQMQAPEKRIWLHRRLYRHHHDGRGHERDDDQPLTFVEWDRSAADPLLALRQQLYDQTGLGGTLTGIFEVRFRNELSVGSAVLREWIDLVGNEFLKPQRCLLISADQGRTFRPDPLAVYVNPCWRHDYIILGRLLGLALYHQVPAPIPLNPQFCRLLLSQSEPWHDWSFKDLADIDPELYQHKVKWLLDTPAGCEPEAILGFELVFTDILEHKGEKSLATSADLPEVLEPHVHLLPGDARHDHSQLRTPWPSQMVALCPNGGERVVKAGDRIEFATLLAHFRLFDSVRPATIAVLEGLSAVIASQIMLEMRNIVSPEEFSTLIAGLSTIDIDDWEANTQYNGLKRSSLEVDLFWKCVRRWSSEDRDSMLRALLQFATGSQRVPAGGFSQLQGFAGGVHRFTLGKAAHLSADSLPMAHACVCTIDLPPYTDLATMESKLNTALEMGSQTFGVST